MLYDDFGLTFEYCFNSDAANSYMVLKLDREHKLQNHQSEIICQNPNSAFAPFSVRRENEDTYIYYNITSKISLSQYLERKRLNRKELLDLLGRIAKNLMLHGNYLLELSSFIIHADFIFVNPATAEVSLLYIPVCCDRNSMEVCRTFLKELVVNSANVDDNARDNYMQRILSYLKADTFSLNDFNRLIVDLRYNEGTYDMPAKPDKEKSESQYNELKAVSCINPVNKSFAGNSNEKVSNRKSILKISLLQVLIVLPVIIICLFLISRGKGDVTSIAGVLIIAAALDILIIKRTAEKSVKKATEEVKKEKPHSKAPKLPAGKIRSSGCADDSLIDAAKAYDTVMISEVSPDIYPYLERQEEHNTERIIIDKGKFIIGRLSSMADHIIKDSTVGKLHAEIVCREGCCYIKDLNSKNGTYINGVRIISNEEHELKDNCRVRFSGYEYVFRQ